MTVMFDGILNCINSDLLGQTRSDSNCREVPGRTLRREKRISPKGTSSPLWLGIQRCLSSLAAARDEAQQTQTGQQHGIGFGFGDTGSGGNLPMVIDPLGLR